MTNTASDDMPDLRRRIERIEAVEACRDRFNSYLYSLDAGHLEELLDLFADDWGIGHTSCVLAQRPSLGVMLNP